MDNLREDFKNWLVRQGIRHKKSQYRQGNKRFRRH